MQRMFGMFGLEMKYIPGTIIWCYVVKKVGLIQISLRVGFKLMQLQLSHALLLLLDVHSIHYQLEVKIKRVRENDVFILCLPLHTTHATQPLDCSEFSPLKSYWSATCHEFFQEILER